MKKQHTPGPWSVTKGLYGNKDELTVWGPEDKEGHSEFVATLGNMQGHDKSNAELIAKAPDYKAACEALIRGDDLQVAIDLARKALGLPV